MKKIFLPLILLAGIFLLAGCNNKEEETGYSINYINKDTTRLVEKGYRPYGDTTEELIDEFMDMLQADPQEVDYRNAISSEIVVKSYSLDKEQLNIDFGEGYSVMDSITEILCRAAVVRTLTQIDGVTYVSFYIDGAPLEDSAGNLVGLMTSESFIQNPGEQINAIQESTITLYFANEKGNGLLKTTKDVYETSNTSMEKLVMEHLIQGTSSNGYKNTIPPDTSLVSVSVLDGVCFVNLSEAFMQQNYDIEEEIVIYSIVNSLTELPNINKVQISVNGNTSMVYREKCSFETLYERNLDYVVSDEAGSAFTEGENSGN
ncbi:MAG: GerMN domain-containing protein [Eubacterium sp.]|jgi:germination protein M|nr:GerMN domain-containing protein [Eubacterium sp.]